jgi:hypothetical protein
MVSLVASEAAGLEEAGAGRVASAEATENSATTSPGIMARRRIGLWLLQEWSLLEELPLCLAQLSAWQSGGQPIQKCAEHK